MGDGSREGETVVLWTGGKDSSLALLEAREQRLGVRALVTFVPPEGAFRAHPLALMAAQADAVGLPHRTLPVRPPYAEDYARALGELRREGVRRLVSGDIDEVQGHEGWLERVAERAGVEVVRPLWHKDRRVLLERVLSIGLRPVITAVRTPHLGDRWVGRALDRTAVDDLLALPADLAIDPCGEKGEYHTMTLGGPGFRHELSLGRWTLEREGDLRYAKLEG